MKRMTRVIGIFACAGLLLQMGCGDAGDNNGSGDPSLADGAVDFIGEDNLALFEEQGFVVHRGANPPAIEGTYEMAHSVVTFDESGQHTGRGLYTYEWTFSDQNNDEVVVSYWSEANDEASGIGGFISGEGDCFTVISQLEGEDAGCIFERVHMFSGCVAQGGIDDFQTAYHTRYLGESVDGTTECEEYAAPRRMSVEQDGLIDRIEQ